MQTLVNVKKSASLEPMAGSVACRRLPNALQLALDCMAMVRGLSVSRDGADCSHDAAVHITTTVQ